MALILLRSIAAILLKCLRPIITTAQARLEKEQQYIAAHGAATQITVNL